MSDLITHFSKVTDVRKDQGKRHPLIDIIAIAIIGVICGADDWVTIEQVWKSISIFRIGPIFSYGNTSRISLSTLLA